MNWFQRYGIPGAVFWGLLILWIIAFYHGRVDIDIIKRDNGKVIAGIIAGSFLPIGYLISVIGQIVYLRYPGVGIDTRARKKAKDKSGCDSNQEWKQEVLSVIEAIKNEELLEQTKFLQEWMRKRMDVLAISNSLICASILSIISALFFPFILKGECPELDSRWFYFALIVTAVVIGESRVITRILKHQLIKVETEMFNYMSDKKQQEEKKEKKDSEEQKSDQRK